MKQSGKRQLASCFSPKNLPLAKKSCLDQAGKGGHGRQVRIQETRIMCSTKHEKGKTGKEDMHSLWIKAQLSLLRKLDWSKLWKRCILTDTERKRLFCIEGKLAFIVFRKFCCIFIEKFCWIFVWEFCYIFVGKFNWIFVASLSESLVASLSEFYCILVN